MYKPHIYKTKDRGYLCSGNGVTVYGVTALDALQHWRRKFECTSSTAYMAWRIGVFLHKKKILRMQTYIDRTIIPINPPKRK